MPYRITARQPSCCDQHEYDTYKNALLLLLARCLLSRHSFAAFASERRPSDWTALPVQILKDTFELQHNSLDNCAAACVCKEWQAAVENSLVSALHLYKDSPSSLSTDAQHWSAYLAARSAITELKLSADLPPSDLQSDSAIDTLGNLLASIPLACNSLSVDEHLAPFVSQYTAQPAQLKHLKINYGNSKTL